MKRTLITIALTTVIVLTLVGIASSSIFGYSYRTPTQSQAFGFGGGGGDGQTEYYAEPSIAPVPGSDAAMPPVELPKSVEQAANTVNAVDVNRLVIKTADMAVVVRDPKADMARITQLANEMGGYVVSSNLYQSLYGPNSIEVPEATITIRVPAERLDEALTRIKEDAVKVNYETTNSTDVTSEYVDLQSRLTAKQAAEKKLLEILEEAVRTEDVLAVYTQLQMIQTEIEALKGQIQYYEQSAALSSISVRLIAQEGTQPITVSPWTPSGAVKEAIEDLIRFAQNFVDFLIYFVLSILPSLILIAIPLYLAFLAGRALYRRFRKPSLVMEEKVEENK